MAENAHQGPAAEPPISPMPVPPGTPLVVLFGGTFDPPHRGHVELALPARDELERLHDCPGRGWLVLVPAARSPLKAGGPAASGAQRAQMLGLALAGRARAGLWADELDRAAAGAPAPSYSVDTLERARRWMDASGCGASTLRLLLGSDQVLDFHRWRRPERIVQLAEPAILLRQPAPTRESLVGALRAGGAWADDAITAWAARVIDVGVVDVAATDLRRLLADPATPPGQLRRLLEPAVLDYIRAQGLYRIAGSAPAAPPPPRPRSA